MRGFPTHHHILCDVCSEAFLDHHPVITFFALLCPSSTPRSYIFLSYLFVVHKTFLLHHS